MKILHVFDHSLPLHSGYTFRSRALLAGQRRRGWETVQLTTPRHTRPGPDPETVAGLSFYRTPAPAGRQLPLLGELREVRATARRLGQLVDAARPDLIHAHSPVLTALAALCVTHARRLPLVYEIRAFWEDAAASHGTARAGGPRYRATRALESYAVAKADAVGCICDGLLADLRRRGVAERKLFTVPNAVDLEQFGEPPAYDPALADRLGLRHKEVIGFIGSFYGYEGLDVLLAALPELVRRRPELHLLLVGGGPEEQALKKQAAAGSAEIAGRVHFTGRVPHDQVNGYYGLIDVLVYPRKSLRLTELVTPLKPLEAMAQEKLIAASDVGGHRELITPGVTGELFAADDPAALAATVAALFEQRERWPQRRATAKDYVRRERNWDATVANYAPVYERLLKKGF